MSKLYKLLLHLYGLNLSQFELNEIREAVHLDDAEQARLAAGRDADAWARVEKHADKPKVEVSEDFGGMA